MNYWLGVDVGSVSTDLVIMNDNREIEKKLYLRTGGTPIETIVKGYAEITDGGKMKISGTGTTGSGRALAGAVLEADVIKNEITAHSVAALEYMPDVKTVIEIGGQDSKLILIRGGIVYDFAMNTVCAAGTGSFLDRQAGRLNIPVEKMGELALKSKSPVRIAGKCAVFAESDMIHKQQEGASREDILAGLCDALVRGYLNNLAVGKELREPIIFQGGVAGNSGIHAAFERVLGKKVNVPPDYAVMGALGAAILACEHVEKTGGSKNAAAPAPGGWKIKSHPCKGCANSCTIVTLLSGEEKKAVFGGRCEIGNEF